MNIIKIILLLAVLSLLGACTSTDENGVTITKHHWFADTSCSVGNNS